MKRILAVLILSGIAYAAPQAKAFFKIARFNSEVVAVSCTNGNTPTVTTPHDTYVIVNCGR